MEPSARKIKDFDGSIVNIKPGEVQPTAMHLALCEAVNRGWITYEKLEKIEDRSDELHKLLLAGKMLVRLPNGLYAVSSEGKS